MIKVKNTFHNGLFECEEIYSDIGMKILEKSNGQLWNTDKDNPITIAQKRHEDYVETSIPYDPLIPAKLENIADIGELGKEELARLGISIGETSEPIKEEEV